MELYKNKNNDIVELIAIANCTSLEKEITAIYRNIKTNEVFTEIAHLFNSEYSPVGDIETDEQLQKIDFIA